LAAIGCSASYALKNAQKSPGHSGGPMKKLMVMAFYADDDLEARVVVETAFVERMTALGLDVVPGFKHFDRYHVLNGREAEVTAKLDSLGLDGLLVFDPIRAKNHDQSAYEDERAWYRALGMDSADFWGAVEQIGDSEDASNFVVQVVLWSRASQSTAWQGTWDIYAPEGYKLEYAREYSQEFADIVIGRLRAERLVL